MILITGGAGYIGSHCVYELLKHNNDVIVFDNLSTGHKEIIDELKKYRDFKFVLGDLKNKNDIDELFKNYDIDSVIHFAGLSIVSESVKNPKIYYENNVLGSLNLFNSMIENNVKKIVFSSTCAIYGDPDYLPIDENHQKKPINPYGKTKLTVENILDDYDYSYGLKSVRLRYFNACGASTEINIGEWHNNETHLIPNILKSALTNKNTLNIFGTDYPTKDGTCIRDYVNIEDLINAHIKALDYLGKYNSTNVFNIGTGLGNSVKEIISECEKIHAQKIKYNISPKRDGDPAVLTANNNKAKDILKWVPDKMIKDTILSAYNWEKYLLLRSIKECNKT